MISRQRKHQLKYPERHQARRAVYDAIQAGKMHSPIFLACTDCGEPAKEYDHYLGYTRENRLEVQPVCRPCHVNRENQRRWPVPIKSQLSVRKTNKPACSKCESSNVYVLANGTIVCRRCGHRAVDGHRMVEGAERFFEKEKGK